MITFKRGKKILNNNDCENNNNNSHLPSKRKKMFNIRV